MEGNEVCGRNVDTLPLTLDSLVVALCADYKRRAEAIASGTLSRRTMAEFRYINCKIADAVLEIADKRYVPIYIDEIAKRTGFAYSRVDALSEISYKTQKQMIKVNIAKKLHLIE